MRSMEKQFEGLGENLHKKMHQARGDGFGIIKKTSLHHFSDDQNKVMDSPHIYNWLFGKIHCCLLIGKSRVTPKKYVTIPRLELVAAVLSVKIAALIRRKLDIE